MNSKKLKLVVKLAASAFALANVLTVGQQISAMEDNDMEYLIHYNPYLSEEQADKYSKIFFDIFNTIPQPDEEHDLDRLHFYNTVYSVLCRFAYFENNRAIYEGVYNDIVENNDNFYLNLRNSATHRLEALMGGHLKSFRTGHTYPHITLDAQSYSKIEPFLKQLFKGFKDAGFYGGENPAQKLFKWIDDYYTDYQCEWNNIYSDAENDEQEEEEEDIEGMSID